MDQMFLITQHRTYRVMQRKLMYCLNENSCFRGVSAAQSALAYTGVPQYIKLMVLAMLESVTLKYIEEIFGKILRIFLTKQDFFCQPQRLYHYTKV